MSIMERLMKLDINLYQLKRELVKFCMWDNKISDVNLVEGIVIQYMDQHYPTWRNCSEAADEFKQVCPECEGKKTMVYSCCTGESVSNDIMMCPICKEHLGEENCWTCSGIGSIYKEYE